MASRTCSLGLKRRITKLFCLLYFKKGISFTLLNTQAGLRPHPAPVKDMGGPPGAPGSPGPGCLPALGRRTQLHCVSSTRSRDQNEQIEKCQGPPHEQQAHCSPVNAVAYSEGGLWQGLHFREEAYAVPRAVLGANNLPPSPQEPYPRQGAQHRC